jgi:hypothetical protein
VKPAALPSLARAAHVCARRSGSPQRDAARVGFAVLLLAMLLFSQWLGMQHRIAHGGWVDGHPAALQAIGGSTPDATDGSAALPDERKPHSCSLVDGTALADTVAVFIFMPPAPVCIKALALWIAYQSWDAPLTRFFFSRAPPVAG